MPARLFGFPAVVVALLISSTFLVHSSASDPIHHSTAAAAVTPAPPYVHPFDTPIVRAYFAKVHELDGHRWLAAVADFRVRQWVNGVARARQQQQSLSLPRASPSSSPSPAPTTSVHGPASGAGSINGWPCGGDVPPCWVMQRESNGQPGAVNYREACDHSGSHAMGLFQLCWPQHAALAARAGCSNPLDGNCNEAMARILYAEEGMGPWGG